MHDTLLSRIVQYIRDHYGVEAERPWAKAPAYIVFWHKDQKRMFCIAATVPAAKLGMTGNDPVDILTVKVGDALLKDTLLQQEGIFPGLGLGQRNWITILLDGSVSMEDIQFFIDRSFWATASAKTRKARQQPGAEG